MGERAENGCCDRAEPRFERRDEDVEVKGLR